jgi:hypothetical protein
MASTRAPLLLCLLALLVGTAGCSPAYVPVRPDGTPGPEPCPPMALEAMRYVRLQVGDGAMVELDVNQPRVSPLQLYEGPLESKLIGDLGMLEPGTRLYGRVWTDGPQVVIRYYEARPRDGEPFPICAVARLAMGQLRKLPESTPGMAVLEFSRAGIYIVDAFR